MSSFNSSTSIKVNDQHRADQGASLDTCTWVTVISKVLRSLTQEELYNAVNDGLDNPNSTVQKSLRDYDEVELFEVSSDFQVEVRDHY